MTGSFTFASQRSQNGSKRGFRLQQVLAGLDDQEISATVDETAGLLDIGFFQITIGDVAHVGNWCPDRSSPQRTAAFRLLNSRALAFSPARRLFD